MFLMGEAPLYWWTILQSLSAGYVPMPVYGGIHGNLKDANLKNRAFL